MSTSEAKEFEKAMREMAADPHIRSECEAVAHEFACTELDGLPED